MKVKGQCQRTILAAAPFNGDQMPQSMPASDVDEVAEGHEIWLDGAEFDGHQRPDDARRGHSRSPDGGP